MRMRMDSGRLLLDGSGLIALETSGILVEDGARRQVPVESFGLTDGSACHVDCGLGRLMLEALELQGGGPAAEAGGKSLEVMRVRAGFSPHGPCELARLALRFSFLVDRSELWRRAGDGFHWVPGIKQKNDDVTGDHFFRSPVAVVTAESMGIALLPVLEEGKSAWDPNRYLDLRFCGDSGSPEAPAVEYGMSRLKLSGHVYFAPDHMPFAVGPSGVRLCFYLMAFHGYTEWEILHAVTNFIWNTNASRYERSLLPQTVPFATYAKYGNGMALQYLWQDGPAAGSGGICLTTFRRGDGVMRGREYADDIWFHAWFNNMRTAMELAYFGGLPGGQEWKRKADAVVRCLLSAPQQEGIFPTIYAPADGGWIGSSAHGGGKGLYSLPDCAWSALWLRKYAAEYGGLPEADGFLGRFREFICRHQDDEGGLPCWVAADGLRHDPRLDRSASGALAIWFMGEELLCGAVRPAEREAVLRAVENGAGHILRHVLPQQRFEDFELYYSCSPKPLGYYDTVTRMYGQNTLAMQWCAEALRVAHLVTGKKEYLDAGVFCLDLLCLYQQAWRHPNLDFYSFGGFGVMNTDGEWNDARQAQFAETLSNFYDATGEVVYLRRAVAATRAGFALMAIDENREVCPMNFEGSAINFEVHGACAENYGHGGANERSYQSGFHWGTGSALVTAAKMKQKYGDVFVDFSCKAAIGIDGVVVAASEFTPGGVKLWLDCLPAVTRLEIRTKRNGGTEPEGPVAVEGFAVRAGLSQEEYVAQKE